jgi:hypothetical protein
MEKKRASIHQPLAFKLRTPNKLVVVIDKQGKFCISNNDELETNNEDTILHPIYFSFKVTQSELQEAAANYEYKDIYETSEIRGSQIFDGTATFLSHGNKCSKDCKKDMITNQI